MRNLIIVVGLGAAAVLQAQPKASLALPVMGVISGSGPAELRALAGLPGAATARDAMQMPEGVRRVHIAPGNRALVQRTGAAIGAMSFDGASAGPVAEIPGAMTRADVVGFSPRGTYAVLHSAQGSRLQVIAFDGDAVRLSGEIDVAGLPGIRQVGIDDTGALPVLVTEEGAVYVAANGMPRQVFRGGAITDVGFVAGKASLLVADAQAGRVTLIDGLPDRAAARVVGMGIETDGQLWVRSSTDGKYVFAAGSGRRTGWRVEIDSGVTRTLELPEVAVEFERLGSGNTFVYSSASGGPVWLLLGDDPELRSVFVPGSGAGVRRGVPAR